MVGYNLLLRKNIISYPRLAWSDMGFIIKIWKIPKDIICSSPFSFIKLDQLSEPKLEILFNCIPILSYVHLKQAKQSSKRVCYVLYHFLWKKKKTHKSNIQISRFYMKRYWYNNLTNPLWAFNGLFRVTAAIPSLTLFCLHHCATTFPSTIWAGDLCSGARRYSTFTTIRDASLKQANVNYWTQSF